jgi:hypothetical protein
MGEWPLEVGVDERLADEVGGAELHRLHHRRPYALARDDDHRHVAVDAAEDPERGEPVHAAWQHDVEDDRRRALLPEAVEARSAVWQMFAA